MNAKEILSNSLPFASLRVYSWFFKSPRRTRHAATYFTPAAVHPVDGLENILAMVTAGYGVAILPEVLVGSSGHACLTKRLRSPVPLFQLRMFWLREASSQVLKNFLAVASRYVIEMDWKLE